MIAVVRFPGSNCDRDVEWALESLGGEVRVVWHRQHDLSGVDAIVLPGGFSFGDYLRSGAIASHSPVMDAVRRFAAAGGPVLGVCNGFQILAESGLLPGALTVNENPHFLCRDATVRVERNDLPFTARYGAGQRITLPVAHAEGRFVIDEVGLAALEERRGVVLRYADDEPSPNGSVAGIAGVVNEGGNVLGMMPHPERAVDPLLGGSDGAPLLLGLLQAAAGGVFAQGRSSTVEA